MDNNGNSKGFFPLILSLDFLFGAGVFIYTAVTVRSAAGRAGFILLALFSFLTVAGIGLTDMSLSKYFRTTTKLFAFSSPFLIFSASFLSAYRISHGIAAASSPVLIWTIIICCTFSAIMGVVLVKRYREDDL